MKNYKLILMAVLFSAGIISCSSDDDALDENNNNETANVRVELTDAPGDYEEVKIEVIDVQVQMEASVEGEDADEEADEQGWMSLDGVQTGVYDLLKLTGGVTQLLADTELPAGHLNQIRLVLGNGNSVTVEGVNYALNTPSAQESGLKLQINEELEAGEDYFFLLDFDVEESVVKGGESGNYNLKPVIRVSTEEAGSIVGSVHPTTQQTLVVATNGSTTVSAYTDEEGDFKLNGLQAGTYLVTVTPDPDSLLPESIIKDVTVEAGTETDLDIIFLEE